VTGVAVSPDGMWIASASRDSAIRLWPMPDATKPPLHTLAHGELLARLRAITNLRVVPDAGSASGYQVEPSPFLGWAKPWSGERHAFAWGPSRPLRGRFAPRPPSAMLGL
jgi:WD40 repeat protein